MLKVRIPSSKSYTHRAYIMASLADGSSRILDPLLSEDTRATLEACRLLGADVSEAKVIGGKLHSSQELDCRNSGTTLRLLTGVCSLFEGESRLFGDTSLNSRPMKELADTLSSLGAQVQTTDGKPPLTVRGPVKGGEVSISGSTSSQFISSLLISLPLCQNDSFIRIDGALVSRPYLDITLEMLSDSGIKIEEKDGGFLIPSSQKYKARDFNLPGDWSSSSYILGAGCFAGSVAEGLREDAQGDRKILDILEAMGADIEFMDGCVHTWPSILHGIEVDCGNTPDLVPTLAVLGAMAKGETRIFGAKHLRFKETDRIAVMAAELSKAGVDVQEKEDGLVVKGGNIRDCTLDPHGDHRIAMALYLLNAKANVDISGKECADVSFPGYFDIMEGVFE